MLTWAHRDPPLVHEHWLRLQLRPPPPPPRRLHEKRHGRKERSENETSARLKRGPQARRQMQ